MGHGDDSNGYRAKLSRPPHRPHLSRRHRSGSLSRSGGKFLLLFTLVIPRADLDSQYYLTMWYCRHEIQFRQALFFSAASIAGAFSGLLAFGIAKMDGVGGLEGWRWIFILEGIVTVLVAILAFFVLYDFPETASFLTDDERAFVVFRLKYQGQANGPGRDQIQVAEADEFKWEYVWSAFKDWQIWVNIFVYWGVSHTSFVLFSFAFVRSLTDTNEVIRLYALCMASAYSSRRSFAVSDTRPAHPSS